MKTIITILSILLLSSCGYQSPNFIQTVIITDVGKSVYQEKGNNNSFCYYIAKGTAISCATQIFANESFCFYDICGKYNVGDTIRLTK